MRDTWLISLFSLLSPLAAALFMQEEAVVLVCDSDSNSCTAHPKTLLNVWSKQKAIEEKD